MATTGKYTAGKAGRSTKGGFLVVCFTLAVSLIISLPLLAQDDDATTYEKDTVVTAGTDALGAGAENVAKALETIFSKFGEPNAYISGSEAGGGLVVGLRYGGGELNHKIEGRMPVHWTGPSVGFDAGANAVKTFALVYGLYDTEDMYTRIAAIEGSFYYVGGMGISVYTKKDMTVAMIRMGGGLRAQATLGYMKFTKKRSINPF